MYVGEDQTILQIYHTDKNIDGTENGGLIRNYVVDSYTESSPVRQLFNNIGIFNSYPKALGLRFYVNGTTDYKLDDAGFMTKVTTFGTTAAYLIENYYSLNINGIKVKIPGDIPDSTTLRTAITDSGVVIPDYVEGLCAKSSAVQTVEIPLSTTNLSSYLANKFPNDLGGFNTLNIQYNYIYNYATTYKTVFDDCVSAYKTSSGTTGTIQAGRLPHLIEECKRNVVNGVVEEFLASGNDINANTFVEFVKSENISIGSKTVFNPAATGAISAIALDSARVLVLYQDSGNNGLGTALVLTLNNSSITVGTEKTYNAATYISPILLDSTHVLICYSSSDGGTSVILTINGTTITVGTKLVFNGQTTNISAKLLNANQVLVCFQDGSNNDYGTAIILTINNYAITSSNKTVFYSGTTYSLSMVVMDSTHAVVCYADGTNNNGSAVVLTISGTTITVGTKVVFNQGSISYTVTDIIDSTHVLVCYSDNFNNSYGTAMALTINNTTITNGTKTVFNAGSTRFISILAMDFFHVFICYTDYSNNNYNTLVVLTINNATLSPGIETIFNTGTAELSIFGSSYISLVKLDATHILVCFTDNGNSSKGTTLIIGYDQCVKASSTKIEGLTQTKCTSTTKGKVWKLTQ